MPLHRRPSDAKEPKKGKSGGSSGIPSHSRFKTHRFRFSSLFSFSTLFPRRHRYTPLGATKAPSLHRSEKCFSPWCSGKQTFRTKRATRSEKGDFSVSYIRRDATSRKRRGSPGAVSLDFYTILDVSCFLKVFRSFSPRRDLGAREMRFDGGRATYYTQTSSTCVVPSFYHSGFSFD